MASKGSGPAEQGNKSCKRQNTYQQLTIVALQEQIKLMQQLSKEHLTPIYRSVTKYTKKEYASSKTKCDRK